MASQDAPGEGSTVEALLERHMDALRAYVHPRLGRQIRARETSGDIVQSVCRNVLEDRERFEFRGEARFRRWLFDRALHKIIDRGRYYRRHKRDTGREVRLQLRSTSGGSTGAQRPEAQTLVTPSRNAIGREDMQALEAAFRELPGDYREVLVLSRMMGLPHETVAERMGKSNGAIRKLLSRALARLATLMDDGEER